MLSSGNIHLLHQVNFTKMNYQKILKKLKKGNKRFVKDDLNGHFRDSLRRDDTFHEQKPFAIILGCSDSRVIPELVFDTGLGELFTVRVAGNIANNSSIASIEYAVAKLKTKLIVVLGHQNCGAVTAAFKGGDYGHNLNGLLHKISPSIKVLKKGATIDEIARKNAELTSMKLIEKSTIIRDAVEFNKLKIVPAYYNLDSGKVEFLD